MVKTVTKTELTVAKSIAAGGEGEVFEHPHNKKKVIKVYHQARKKEFVDHLLKIKSLSSDKRFVVPDEIYVDNSVKVLGYSMDFVNFNDYFLFNNLFNKGYCISNNIDKAFKIKILEQLQDAIKVLHKSNIVVGDLNQYNLFVSKKGEILFVDTDSYATQANPHSGVLLDDIRDFNTNDINETTDTWAYDILCFWATTFCHPFKWVIPGNKENIEMKIRNNKSYLNTPGIKIPPLYEPPTGEVEKQFKEIFGGRRFFIDFHGVNVSVPVVIKQSITPSSDKLSIRKLYDDVLDMYNTDSYSTIKTSKGWKHIEHITKGFTKETGTKIDSTISDVYLFPCSNSNTASIQLNKLFGLTDKVYEQKEFNQPLITFNNGYLGIVEYNDDIQWNYNINNQMAGIQSSNIPVFAKSFVNRTSLLQNFGSKKYVNIPKLHAYILVEVPLETKDALVVGEYMLIEYKNKANIEYKIVEVNDPKHGIFVNGFRYFGASKNTMFVPEDGKIDVYINSILTVSMECNICTENSKIVYTKSGILLLENKELYLLNTK